MEVTEEVGGLIDKSCVIINGTHLAPMRHPCGINKATKSDKRLLTHRP